MFNRADHPQTQDATDALRRLIAERKLGPGDRLPAERQLMDLLGVGRSSLRRALDRLDRDGTIWRHVGKGTFVAEASSGQGGPDIFAGIGAQLTPYRMIRARMTIEPALAREAAGNASREAMARIDAARARQRAAASWLEYERQDDRFHRAIAEAADNALLLALFDSLNRVRREVALGTVTRVTARPPENYSSILEHDAIAAAVSAHDPDAAFHAMRGHLHSVSSRLFGDL